MKTKQPPEVRDAFGEAIKSLGPPSNIYTDEDGGFQREFAEFLQRQGIQHRITRAHAPFVERFIRTLKRMVFLRQEGSTSDKSWEELLPTVLAKYNKTSHTSHGSSPNYAHDRENAFYVRQILDARAKKRRRYPPLEVGDAVKVLTKPSKFKMKKEHTKEWGAVEKVERIERGDITFYVLEGGTRGCMRHELLKITPAPNPPNSLVAELPNPLVAKPRRRLVGKQRNPNPS